MCSSRHTTPVGFPSFPLPPKVKHRTKEIVIMRGRTERSHDNCPSYPAKMKNILQVYCKGDLRWEETSVKEAVQYHYLLQCPLGGHCSVHGCCVVAAQFQHDLDVGGAASVGGFVWL